MLAIKKTRQTAEAWNPAQMIEEEELLELEEAQLSARNSELGRREGTTDRAIDDACAELSELVRAGVAGLRAELADELPRPRDPGEPVREQLKCAAARRAAIEARQAVTRAEQRRAEQREAALQESEKALVELRQLLEQGRAQQAARKAQAKKAAETAPRAIHVVPPPAPAKPVATEAAPKIGAERRQHSRIALETRVDLGSDSNFYSGFSSDLSDGGIFVATCKLLPFGTMIDVRFTLPTGEPVNAQGVVRWVREFNDRTPEIFPGMGVEFVGMSEECRTAVHQFVAQREPMFWCS